MKERFFVWPALGAVLALLVLDATERWGLWSAVLFAIIGAAIGLGVAWLMRHTGGT